MIGGVAVAVDCLIVAILSRKKSANSLADSLVVDDCCGAFSRMVRSSGCLGKCTGFDDRVSMFYIKTARIQYIIMIRNDSAKTQNIKLYGNSIIRETKNNDCCHRRREQLYVGIHQYADDIQTYIVIQPQCPDSLSQLVTCTDDITHWFLENGLLLNPSKTEAVVFRTASRLQSANTTGGVKVAGTSLQFSDTVKLLGVELDQALSMERHVSSVVRSCNFHIRALRHIRPRLTFDAAKSVAVSIVGVRLDYYNSLLRGTSQRNTDRLQRV